MTSVEQFSVGKMTGVVEGWDVTVELVSEVESGDLWVRCINFNWIEAYNPVHPPKQYESIIEGLLRTITDEIEHHYDSLVSLSRAFFSMALDSMRLMVTDKVMALMEELKPEYKYIYDVMEMENDEEHVECSD